jgi:hypothetical protein
MKSNDSINDRFSRLSGYIENAQKLSGKAILANGKEVKWAAIKTAPFLVVKDSSKADKPNLVLPVTFPNIAYGNNKKPSQQTILFKNATVWTNEKEGILVDTDVLVKDGKIAAIGKNIEDSNAVKIDAKGKHLTSGIIDEHSHIAISKGVNEGGHNSSAEVTIQEF